MTDFDIISAVLDLFEADTDFKEEKEKKVHFFSIIFLGGRDYGGNEKIRF